MNYHTFSILQPRPLLKKSFLIDLRDTIFEKTSLEPVGIACLVLMFRKASNIQF